MLVVMKRILMVVVILEDDVKGNPMINKLTDGSQNTVTYVTLRKECMHSFVSGLVCIRYDGVCLTD